MPTTELSPHEALNIIKHYQENPIEYIEESLGVRTWSGMRLAIDSVFNNKRTSVRACHSISKTFSAAAIAVTFLSLYSPSIVITTAPTHRQVESLLWKEIRTLYIKAEKKPAGDCQTLSIKVEPEWYMIGFSTDYAPRMEGWHSPNILFIIDEAKFIPQWLYDAIEGSMMGPNSRILEISTTDGADAQCPFRKHHTSRRSEWNCIKFSAFDSPFVDPTKYKKYDRNLNRKLYAMGKPKNKMEWPIEWQKEIAIADEAWIDDRRKVWEENNPYMFVTKVCGEFSDVGGDNIIPLAWIESAIEAEVSSREISEYGLDVARFGDDLSVLFERVGGTIFPCRVWGKKNTMATSGIVAAELNEKGIVPFEVPNRSIVKIDSIGVGAGVFDRLAELGYPVYGVESASKAYHDTIYFNLKAEMWFSARAVFERQYREGNIISIPDDPELIEDLSSMHYDIHSDGRYIVEKKEAFKKRFGRSPNKGDAFIYCIYHFPEMVKDGYYSPEDVKKGLFI